MLVVLAWRNEFAHEQVSAICSGRISASPHAVPRLSSSGVLPPEISLASKLYHLNRHWFVDCLVDCAVAYSPNSQHSHLNQSQQVQRFPLITPPSESAIDILPRSIGIYSVPAFMCFIKHRSTPDVSLVFPQASMKSEHLMLQGYVVFMRYWYPECFAVREQPLSSPILLFLVFRLRSWILRCRLRKRINCVHLCESYTCILYVLWLFSIVVSIQPEHWYHPHFGMFPSRVVCCALLEPKQVRVTVRIPSLF